MSTEANKDIIRRWVEVWNSKNVAAVADLVTADYVRHDPNLPEIRGIPAEQQLVSMFLRAFPDLHFTIDDMLAEGDKVMLRVTGRGTHQGELLGVPPTDQHVTFSAMLVYRLAGGKIAEQWALMDTLGLLQQLGALPTLSQPGA